MTSKKFGIALLALLVLAIFAVSPASASISVTDITKAQTVFIGESGLNIQNATNQNGAGPMINTIYWFADSNAAAYPLDITGQNATFLVSEGVFGSKTGAWYDNASIYGNVTFYVEYPYINNIQIYDNSTATVGGDDITGQTAIAGDMLQIAFQTNLYTLINQRGVTTAGLKAKVQTPDGVTLTGLINESGMVTDITNVLPSTQKYYVQNTSATAMGMDIWNTGNAAYPAGTYKVWLESNINSMKDNMGAITGKTVSAVGEVTIDKETVTITADKETVIRNNQFAVTITGKPATVYTLWVSGTNSYSATTDYPPKVIANQKDVVPGTNGAAVPDAFAYVYKTGTSVWQDIPNGTTGTNYFCANVTTGSDGMATVGFGTDTGTKAATYTIRAQRGAPADNMYDSVKVKVEKGAVTITASGDGSYYLGEEVVLSGTNTDSDNTYLFITGPNLPTVGGSLISPEVTVTDGTAPNYNFTVRPVKSDDTWDYKWDTASVGLDAGTYTIYAVNAAKGKSDLSGYKYDTVSIVIKKPFVTATTSASTVAKGDKLYVRGTAEGNPTPGVAIWILGKNYWNGAASPMTASQYATETVADDGSFEYEIGTATTKSMASGQYFVVVQHPMYNDQFDVITDATPATYVLVTESLASAAGATNLQFIIWGAGKLQGSDAAEALIDAINSPDIDDTYTKLTFLVEEPWIRINSIGDHYVGDVFTLTGTTNLAVGDDLIVEVTSSSFAPTQKTQSGEFSGVSETVKVVEGDSYNEWSMDVDAATFKPDEYIVNVEAIEADATATTTFNVLKGAAPTTGPTTPTSGPTTAPTTGPTTVPTPEPTASPGFGAFVALIGLGAVAALVMRKD